MIKKRPLVKRTACLLYPDEIKGVEKGAKAYKVSKNHYKRSAIRNQLIIDGFLENDEN